MCLSWHGLRDSNLKQNDQMEEDWLRDCNSVDWLRSKLDQNINVDYVKHILEVFHQTTGHVIYRAKRRNPWNKVRCDSSGKLRFLMLYQHRSFVFLCSRHKIHRRHQGQRESKWQRQRLSRKEQTTRYQSSRCWCLTGEKQYVPTRTLLRNSDAKGERTRMSWDGLGG